MPTTKSDLRNRPPAKGNKMRLAVFCLFLTCFAPLTPLQAAGEGLVRRAQGRRVIGRADVGSGYRVHHENSFQ